jgi:hypothetical protein
MWDSRLFLPLVRQVASVVNRLLAIAFVLGAASSAHGWPSLSAPQQPHPAVARVAAVEKGGFSLGSGILVAVNDTHGLVVTNHHVVRDATGPVSVSFPDGFRSGAVILKVDRVWDLAALAIRRPNVQPVPVAAHTPQLGEVLTIAGYGAGQYRAASGRCVNYVSPGGNHPREWVEVSVGARQGDSGGPIFNQRGEVAGVLFGTGSGETLGSYCGRVRYFLASTAVDFDRLSPRAYMAAQPATAAAGGEKAVNAPPAGAAITGIASATAPVSGSRANQEPPPRPTGQTPGASVSQNSPSVPHCSGGVCTIGVPSAAPPLPPPPATPALKPGQPSAPAPAAVAAQSPNPSTSGMPSPTRTETIKTILAAVGALLLLFHGIRLVGASVG